MALLSRFSELHPRRFFLETWRQLDEEAALERAANGDRYDYGPLAAFALGAVFLVLMDDHYLGGSRALTRTLAFFSPNAVELGGQIYLPIHNSPFFRLIEFTWWAGWRVLGYFVFPVLVIKLVLRERIRDYGLETKGFSEHAWIYGVFYCIVLIGVVGVSFTAEFSTYYPFYKLASRSVFDFVAWELLYAAQFLSLEFFFRGFLLKACKRSLGSHAIFAMVVPYAMIHIGKPWLESVGAVIAGIALGTLAMKTRSIWSGFLIHVSVAISMDVAALLQTDGLPRVWWPELS